MIAPALVAGAAAPSDSEDAVGRLALQVAQLCAITAGIPALVEKGVAAGVAAQLPAIVAQTIAAALKRLAVEPSGEVGIGALQAMMPCWHDLDGQSVDLQLVSLVKGHYHGAPLPGQSTDAPKAFEFLITIVRC